MAQVIRKQSLPYFFCEYFIFPINYRRRMKPTRIRMCHSLVMNYGLYEKMEIFVGQGRSVLYPPD